VADPKRSVGWVRCGTVRPEPVKARSSFDKLRTNDIEFGSPLARVGYPYRPDQRWSGFPLSRGEWIVA